VQLTVSSNGAYDFAGHLHDSGFIGFSDSLVFAIESPSGVLYDFEHTGTMSGTIDKGSRDDNWNVSGIGSQIAANWADLEGASSYWDVNTNASLSSVVNGLVQDLEGIPTAIQIILV
jgi:hypothetical protein